MLYVEGVHRPSYAKLQYIRKQDWDAVADNKDILKMVAENLYFRNDESDSE